MEACRREHGDSGGDRHYVLLLGEPAAVKPVLISAEDLVAGSSRPHRRIGSGGEGAPGSRPVVGWHSADVPLG